MDRVLQRRDTAANWSSTNPILAEGELGIITDGAKGYKIGDGLTRWNALEFPANPTSVVGELGDSEVAVINQKGVTNLLSFSKNVYLIPSLSTGPDFYVNINTVDQYVDFGSDPILVVGSNKYVLKDLLEDTNSYRKISYQSTTSSALLIYFDIVTYNITILDYHSNITSYNKIIIGYIRFNSLPRGEELQMFIGCDYTINGSIKVQHINQFNVSFIPSKNQLPNIDTTTNVLDLGDNPIFTIGGKTYDLASIWPDNANKYRSIPLYISGNPTGAINIVFNINTNEIYPVAWNRSITITEVIIGTVRLVAQSHEFVSANFVFEYNINEGYVNQNLIQLDINETNVANYNEKRLIYTYSIPKNAVKQIEINVNSNYNCAINGFLTDVNPLEAGLASGVFDSLWQSNKYILDTNNANGANYFSIAFREKNNSNINPSDISSILKGVILKFDANYIFDKSSITSNYTKTLRAKTNLEFISHRGLHLNDIPENSLDAYRYAGYLGFEFAETDFCPTLDGELVLMHDETINRTMRNTSDYSIIENETKVADKTLQQLRENYVLASSDYRMRRPIPTLEEFFITCKNSGIFPIPEIKTSGTTTEHVNKAFKLGKEILGEGNFGFCSFSYDLLDYVRSLSEKTPLWYIGNSILGTTNSITNESRETTQTIWYPQYSSVTQELVKQYTAKGMKIAVWTVPVNEFDNIIKLGVQQVASDYVGPTLSGCSGIGVTSDNNFNNFVTTGTVENSILNLQQGNQVSFKSENMWIGGYYLSIIGKGKFTITAPNLSITIDNNSVDRYIYQGLINKQSTQFQIIAIEPTEIEFIEFYSVEF